MRVLVTGHRGYVGSVVAGVLQRARYEIVGLDCDFYRDCDYGRIQESIPSFDIDVRDVEFTDLLSFDAVVHLADLPEAASSEFDPALTREINEAATIRLAECCKKADVSRLLFASSCSVYGRGDGAPGGGLDEQSPVAPNTSHAASKLRCERALARLGDHTFAPVILRHASVYGVSPRLRTDLIVNDFVASATVTGRVLLRSDGRAWRPLVHVEDLARAYAALLVAPDERVSREAFNVLPGEENYRVIDVADLVTELVPDCTREPSQYVFDEPSYRVDASKFMKTFPKFSFRWTLALGIRQLRNAIMGSGLTPGDWRSDRYRRVLRLKRLIESGRVSADLRCAEPACS